MSTWHYWYPDGGETEQDRREWIAHRVDDPEDVARKIVERHWSDNDCPTETEVTVDSPNGVRMTFVVTAYPDVRFRATEKP